MSKVITFWSPVSRQGSCSTNAALFISYLSKMMNEIDKAVLFSLCCNIDSTDYIEKDMIREGISDLSFFHNANEIVKEDILTCTHKVTGAFNIDILGTNKQGKTIESEYLNMIDLLKIAYEWVVVDCINQRNKYFEKLIEISDVIVVCLPQDKFVCEDFTKDLFLLEDKKIVFLTSNYNSKNNFSLQMLELLLPGKVFKISQDNKIGQAINSQNIYSFVSGQKKTLLMTELDSIYYEVSRLINLSSLNINYDVNQKADKREEIITYGENCDIRNQQQIKIVKEYKVVKTKNNVMVLNMSPGAGSTFTTLNLAYFIADKKMNVSVIEIPHEQMRFDILNIIGHDESYKSVAEKLKSGLDEDECTPKIKDKIKFYCNSSIIDSWSLIDHTNYINLIGRQGTINIYDAGSQKIDENILFTANILDTIIVIVDPMPEKILQAEKRNEEIRQLGDKNAKFVYVLNKYIKDIDKKNIEKYFNIKFEACIPFLEPETIYSAAYGETVPLRIKRDDLFNKSLRDIVVKSQIIDLEERKSMATFVKSLKEMVKKK